MEGILSHQAALSPWQLARPPHLLHPPYLLYTLCWYCDRGGGMYIPRSLGSSVVNEGSLGGDVPSLPVTELSAMHESLTLHTSSLSTSSPSISSPSTSSSLHTQQESQCGHQISSSHLSAGGFLPSFILRVRGLPPGCVSTTLLPSFSSRPFAFFLCLFFLCFL